MIEILNMFKCRTRLVKGNARAKLSCPQIAETLDEEEIARELCQEMSKSNLTPGETAVTKLGGLTNGSE